MIVYYKEKDMCFWKKDQREPRKVYQRNNSRKKIYTLFRKGHK